MKLAHVSDLHLLPAELETARKGPTSVEVAMAIADDLIRIQEGLDLIVVSGDLVELADEVSFKTFEQIFGCIDRPLLIVPGNHDGPSGMIDYMRGSSVLADWNLSNRMVETGHLRFLGLNTSVDGRTGGALDDEALALVEREIHRETDTRLVLVMHHPPLLLGLAQFDSFCQIERGDELLRLLTTAKQDISVLSGHVHRPYMAREGNVTCYVAGSMVAPYDSVRPFGTDPIQPAEFQDFYFVHDMDRSGRHVVTPQRVRGLASLPTSVGAVP